MAMSASSNASTSFEAECLKFINAKYSVTVMTKAADKGPVRMKLKLGNAEHSKESVRSSNKHKCPSGDKHGTKGSSRKRKDKVDGDDAPESKRRCLNSVVEKFSLRPANGLSKVLVDSPLTGLRKSVAAKRASKDLRKQKKGKDSPSESNCSDKDLLGPQALRKLSVKELHLCKRANEPDSPLRKMSAFEISLLKGQQSVERRRSQEAATLRSSPRINSIGDQPNYCVKRKRRTKLEMSMLDRKETNGRKRGRSKSRPCVGDKLDTHNNGDSASTIENKCVKTKRSRSCSTGHTKPRKSKQVSRSHSTLDRYINSSPAVAYRMNGSPKLKSISGVLNLNNLSGIQQKLQGSSFTSLQSASRVSGNRPALPVTPPTSEKAHTFSRPTPPALEKLAPIFSKPHSRPASLPVNKNSDSPTGSIIRSVSHLELSSKLCSARDNVDSLVKKCSNRTTRQPTLEEIVNSRRRLRPSTAKSLTSSAPTPLSPTSAPTPMSPTSSEGRTSRRSSSRSTTPNISPIKSEILTPSCTPTSTPSKSPRESPFRSMKSMKKKRYLFAVEDDVLARWHDGLFYLGKILRIDDNNQKCLMKYEDDSEYWSMFKDIHRVLNEEEMICCICLGISSEPPDEIVLCDICCQGYHQRCHSPDIESGQIVDPDDEWYCRQCIFLTNVKLGGALKDGTSADQLRMMKQTLPYDLDKLTWDVQHKNNVEQYYCYCGGPGLWYQKMLQCCRCKQWFHEACIQCLDHPLLFADSFFIFVCSSCNSGNEFIRRLDIQWPDITHIALFNLSLEHHRKYFDLFEEILPWLEENWQAMQVSEFDKLSSSEKEKEVLESLKGHKTRFVSASELRRKHSLWGLRVRVPPPRILINFNLPKNGIVNDKVMQNLKIKGRRTKVLSVECNSPVKQLKYGPLHPNKNKAQRKLNTSLTKDDGTYGPAQKESRPVSSAPAVVRHTSRLKLPLLDSLIPRQTSYTGHLHPFATELEQDDMKHESETRAQIWDCFLASVGKNPNGDCEEDGPPILEKVEPVVPSASQNGTPPMPIIQEKKGRGRKSEVDGEKKDKRRSGRKVSLKPEPVSNPVEVHNSNGDFIIKRLKGYPSNYYCAYDKSGYGQGFQVMGGMVGAAGHQYIVHWEK